MNYLSSVVAHVTDFLFIHLSLPTISNGQTNHDYKCPMTQEHLDAARLCHKVYDDEFLHQSERFVDAPVTDVQCSMSVPSDQQNKLYVVFRGSDDFNDWFHNFKIDLVKYPNAFSNPDSQCHTGFLIQWLSVKQEIQGKIGEMIEQRRGREDCKPIDTIVLTGHSAGSPPACLCALELGQSLDLKNIDVQVITFGSPRFSNQYFKNDFEAQSHLKCTRIVLDRDLVTRFPTSLYSEYKHVGKPLQLRGSKYKYVVQRDTTNLEAFRHFLLGILSVDVGVSDHMIENYVEEIETILKRNKI